MSAFDIKIAHLGYSPIIQGIVGNYVLFQNCTFGANVANTFGGAIAIYSLIVLDHRERIKPMDVSNWYVHLCVIIHTCIICKVLKCSYGIYLYM